MKTLEKYKKNVRNKNHFVILRFFTARCYAEQSAVMPQYIVCPSLYPSVRNV